MDPVGLVNQAKGGGKDAFIFLFENIKKSLFIIALSILKNESDVEDTLQDTCIFAYTSLSKLSKPDYF